MSERLLSVPLPQLQRSKENVRKTGRGGNIEALAAMIDAQGLLQNLVVRPMKANGRSKPHYEVTAGDRRLQALRLLAKRKRLPTNFKVPCMLDEGKASTLEVSLAENVGREALHPADQFEAFAQLQAQGLGSADIAARFGVTKGVVEQRLKLAAVSPRLMSA